MGLLPPPLRGHTGSWRSGGDTPVARSAELAGGWRNRGQAGPPRARGRWARLAPSDPALWFPRVTGPCVDPVLSGLWASSRAAVSRQGAHAALGLSLRAPSAPQDPGWPELALTQPGAGGRGAWHPRGPCGHRSAPRPGSGHSRRGRAAPGRSLGTRELRPPPLHSAAPPPRYQCLLLVDSVASAGGVPIHMDRQGKGVTHAWPPWALRGWQACGNGLSGACRSAVMVSLLDQGLAGAGQAHEPLSALGPQPRWEAV